MDNPFDDMTDRQLITVINKVVDLYEDGMTIEDICNQLQFTSLEVQWCLNHG